MLKCLKLAEGFSLLRTASDKVAAVQQEQNKILSSNTLMENVT